MPIQNSHVDVVVVNVVVVGVVTFVAATKHYKWNTNRKRLFRCLNLFSSLFYTHTHTHIHTHTHTSSLSLSHFSFIFGINLLLICLSKPLAEFLELNKLLFSMYWKILQNRIVFHFTQLSKSFQQNKSHLCNLQI